MTASATALVIGGGIVGLFTAKALHEAGYAVTVLDQGEPGEAASWAGGGILSPLPPWQAADNIWALVQDSLAIYAQVCAGLVEATGIDPEYVQSGMQVSGEDDQADASAWALRTGLEITRCPDTDALWLPWVAQLRNPRLCRALVVHLRQQGIVLHSHTPVTGWVRTADRVIVQTRAQPYQADITVLTAGAWSGGLASALGWSLPVAPVKGQMIALQGAPGLLPHIVLRQGRYLIPRRDGVVLVGSTLEYTGFDGRLETATADALESFARETWPALSAARRIGHWCGFRPGTPTGVPIIESHPEIKGLFVNAGHFRYGLTMAPASAARLLKLALS